MIASAGSVHEPAGFGELVMQKKLYLPILFLVGVMMMGGFIVFNMALLTPQTFTQITVSVRNMVQLAKSATDEYDTGL